jgi:hypothetical protein
MSTNGEIPGLPHFWFSGSTTRRRAPGRCRNGERSPSGASPATFPKSAARKSRDKSPCAQAAILFLLSGGAAREADSALVVLFSVFARSSSPWKVTGDTAPLQKRLRSKARGNVNAQIGAPSNARRARAEGRVHIPSPARARRSTPLRICSESRPTSRQIHNLPGNTFRNRVVARSLLRRLMDILSAFSERAADGRRIDQWAYLSCSVSRCSVRWRS